MVSWCAYPLLSHCLASPGQMSSNGSASASGSRRMTMSSWKFLSLRRNPHTMLTAAAGSNCCQSWRRRAIRRWPSTTMSSQNHVQGRVAWFKDVPATKKHPSFLFLAIADAHIDLGLPDAFLRNPDCIWFRAHLLSLRWLTLRTWLLPDQTQANGDALLLDQSQHQPAEVHGHWQRVSREGVGTYPLGFATFHPDLLGLGLTYHYSHSVSLQTGGSTATKHVGKCWQDWYHDVGRCLSGPTIDHVLNWYRIPLWNKNPNTGGLDSNFLKVFGWATQRSSQFGKATVWVCWVLGGAQRPNAARQNATRNACQSVLPYRSTNNLPQYRCRWRNIYIYIYIRI